MIVTLERLAEVGLHDGVGWEDIVAFSAGAMTVFGLLALVFRKPLAEFGEFLRWWRKFQVDWDGEDAREGRDHTPGVMERLNNIDGEFKRNGGKTMKDAMYRTERAVNDMSERLQVVERDQRAYARDATDQRDAMTSTLDAVESNTNGKDGT